jgi:hypothetical protein
MARPGEHDRTSNLIVEAQARPMSDARQGRHEPRQQEPQGLAAHPEPNLRPSRFTDAISIDDLNTSTAACSNPEVLAGGELHVAERYGG